MSVEMLKVAAFAPAWRRSAVRVRALVIKETRQILRDPASIGIGLVLPLVLIVLFGYGLSLDTKNVPVAIVLEDSSPAAYEGIAGFTLSKYFKPRLVRSMREAQELMLDRKVDGIVRVPSDFTRRLKGGHAQIEVLVHGSDANQARIIRAYAQGAMASWSMRQAAQGNSALQEPVTAQTRVWFNEANESRYFLVPGLIMLVMTLIGALLTAMVMAREWERGTIESLFVTPVRREEILLSKTIPYLGLGMIALALCILAARFLFHVPLRGSLVLLIGTSLLYVLVALGIGLVISSSLKNQLAASQVTLLATYMPALMLSGFLFDLRSMPVALQWLTHLLPVRYYATLLQTLFLTGNVWRVVLPNSAVLMLMIGILWLISRSSTRKRLS